MIKKTSLDLYPFNIWVGLLSDKQEVLRRFDFFVTVDKMLANEPLSVEDLDFDEADGITYVVRERKTNAKGSLSLISEEVSYYEYKKLFDVVSHEAAHAADIIWEGLIGMNAKDDFDSNNKNEPYVYLLGYIAGIIGSCIMQYKKEDGND